MYDEAKDLKYHREVVEGLYSSLERLKYRSRGFRRCLDVGGGAGLHAPWLQLASDHVIVTDVIKYETVYDHNFRRDQHSRFQRHSIAVDYDKLEYHTVDAQDLIYKDRLFDFVVSFDAFEHIPDPSRAFAEIARVLAPGGVVALHFDPIWNSPFGHHLKHVVPEPWMHLMLSNADFESLIIERIGADRAKRAIEIFRNDMNRRPFAFYETLFREVGPKYFDSIHFNYWAQHDSDEPNVAHPNFAHLLNAGFERTELMARGLRFYAVRKADG